MATQIKIPLNTFKLVLTPLDSGSNTIYQQNVLDVSTIILSLHISNLTDDFQRATVKLQKGDTVVTLVRNAAVPPEEALNPFSGRVVLEKTNALIIESSAPSGSLEAALSILENANA